MSQGIFTIRALVSKARTVASMLLPHFGGIQFLTGHLSFDAPCGQIRDHWAAVLDIYLRYTDVHSQMLDALICLLTLIERPEDARLRHYKDIINFVQAILETDLFSIVMEGRHLCTEFNKLMEEEIHEEEGDGQHQLESGPRPTEPLLRPHQRFRREGMTNSGDSSPRDARGQQMSPPASPSPVRNASPSPSPEPRGSSGSGGWTCNVFPIEPYKGHPYNIQIFIPI